MDIFPRTVPLIERGTLAPVNAEAFERKSRHANIDRFNLMLPLESSITRVDRLQQRNIHSTPSLDYYSETSQKFTEMSSIPMKNSIVVECDPIESCQEVVQKKIFKREDNKSSSSNDIHTIQIPNYVTANSVAKDSSVLVAAETVQTSAGPYANNCTTSLHNFSKIVKNNVIQNNQVNNKSIFLFILSLFEYRI